MDAAVSRRRLWKILRLVGALLLLVVLRCGLWLKTVEWRSWGRMEQRLGEIDREIVDLDGTRPVLYGAALPGDAAEDYAKAYDRVSPTLDRKILSWFLDRDARADPAASRRLVLEHQEALAQVSKGAHRTLYRRSGSHEELEHLAEISGREFPRSRGQSLMILLLAASVRIHGEEGRGKERIESLLDLAQFSADLCREGDFMPGVRGLSGCQLLFTEAFDALGAELDPADLATLEVGLDRLEGSFLRNVGIMLGFLENWGRVIIDGRALEFASSPRRPLRSTDYGGLVGIFSTRLALSASFHQSDARIQRLKGLDLEPWARESSAFRENSIEVAQSWNLADRVVGPNLIFGPSARRRVLAQIRLLRLGLHYRRTGAILELGDPYGDTLRHREQGALLTAWSVGPDAVDDGGIGDFKKPHDSKDIVLEVLHGRPR